MTNSSKKSSILDGDLISIHINSKPRKSEIYREKPVLEMVGIQTRQKGSKQLFDVKYETVGGGKQFSESYVDNVDNRDFIVSKSISLVNDYVVSFEKNNEPRRIINSFKNFKTLKPTQKFTLIIGSTLGVAAFSATEALAYICSPGLAMLYNATLLGLGINEVKKQMDYKKYKLASDHFNEVASIINDDTPKEDCVGAVYGLKKTSYSKLKKGIKKI